MNIVSQAKMGEMGASSILFPCWFVLILFGPIVYGENLRDGALPKLSEAMKGETQGLESFSGRKFGYTRRFSTRKMLISPMDSREMEEGGLLVQRRLLAENATKHGSLLLQKTKAEDKAEKGKTIQIQLATSKGTKDIGQSSTKPEDKSVKEIPAMETIHPDHSTLRGKDNNAERSEAKVEKLQDGEKINSVQKPVKNKTEQNINNGSENTMKDKSPLLQKTLTKKAEDGTELGKKLQIQAASSQRAQEIIQASKKPVEGSVKEIPVMETIHPDHSTLERKDNNAERSEAKVEKLQSGEKVKSVQKPLEKGTEHNNNNGGMSTTKGESPLLQKTETKNTEDEAEKGKKLQIRAASSKGPEEISNHLLTKNSQRNEAETHAISAEIHGIGSGKATNSTGTGVQKIDSEEARNVKDSATIQMQNTTDEVQEEKGIKVEAAANSFVNKMEIKQAESSEDSTDTEAQRTESIEEEFSANSTVTMDSAEMQWRAQNLRNNKDVEIEDPADEYNDLMQEFTDLPSKLHDTAEKVADQLMPGIQKFSNRSKVYFSLANKEIAHGFRPLVGHHYAAFVASGISCTFLLLPLLVAIIVFEQIRSFFPLQKVILLANIYLANYFATLVFTSFIIGMEPLEFFYKNSVSGYIYLQLLQELGFLMYLSMQCFNVVATCSKRTILKAKLGSVVQLSVAVCIGLHYYVTVFHRAMAQKPPRTCWRVHCVYSLLFGILCLLSRIRHGKKEYVQAADYNTNKKN